MLVFFYDIFLLLYKAGAFIGSLFNSKTKKWRKGRKGIFEKMKDAIPTDAKIVWMHCSSLGEFEQGRPVLEKIRLQYPRYKILLTFFSPSGYEVQKNYTGADWIFYLPMDGAFNAKRFLKITHPSLVIFVKYDLWYYYLKEIKKRNVSLLLVSALVSKDMVYFKWYGWMQRKMLPFFSHFFVQNSESKKLLDEMGYNNTSAAGDTRFDRVIEIAEKFEPIPFIENFIAGYKIIVAGSTWPEDEQVLQKALINCNNTSLKLIIAPHELGEKNINSIKSLFPNAVLFSALKKDNLQSATKNCLIVDNVGMLSRLYRYGDITYVGGGMTNYGVHNVLEAAVYHKPVIIGPYYQKYIEAIGLVNCGGAMVIKNETGLAQAISTLLSNTDDRHNKACEASGNYVQQHAGATEKILQFIQENRLLTN